MKQTPKPTTTRRSCEGRNPLDETLNNLITDNLNTWTTAIKSKSRTGRGSNKTYELYGIKKLRALILDLAVRGLLVPQDPNDEPASELLKKIKAEKEALIKAGKIKKQKVLPEISEEEKPFELPVGWEFVRLQNIIKISSGNGLTSSKMIKSGNIPVYGGNGITGYHNVGNVNHETLVIGRVGYYCGSIHITPKIAWITDNAFITSFSKRVLNINFLYWLLRATNLKENDSATAQPVISGRKIYPIIVALPPLKEQKRIVAKVDKLMALCDQLEQLTDNSIKAHKLLVQNLLNALTQAKDHKTFQEAWQRIAKHFDTLFTTEQSIDQLKQTILQLAVMGKLVPQNPNDEPASELLKKIATEKEKLIKQGKIKKQKPLFTLHNDELIFQAPSNWECIRFGEVINILTDYHANGSYKILKENIELLSDENFAIMLRTTNFSEVNRNSYKYITEKAYNFLEKSKVYEGDIIMNKIGDPGVSFYVDDRGKPMSLAMNLFLLRTSSFIQSKYVYLYLVANYNYIKSFEAGTSTQTITKDAVNNLVFSLPPLMEQKRIVAEADKLADLCDQMKSQITSSKMIQSKIADTLTQL